MIKVTTITARRRLPEEVAIARVAIRNMCLECMGYSPNEVKACTAPECWLYPWRTGTPKELKRSGERNTEGLAKARAKRAGAQ